MSRTPTRSDAAERDDARGAELLTKPARVVAAANLDDYETALREFSWDDARSWLDGLPGSRAEDGLNIAYEAVGRHAIGNRRDQPALVWIGKSARIGGAAEGVERRTLSYAQLDHESRCFARVLEMLGVARGDRVFSLLGRVPELYSTALGTLARGAVFCPLFSAFGPEPIRARLGPGHGRVLVTTARLYQKKVAAIRDALPDLEFVIVTDRVAPARTGSLPELLERVDREASYTQTKPEDPALLHFTSGTTGKPKGALHVHEAVVVHHATGRFALDLHPGDVYWCTADPGWVTGTSYGIVAPLSCGATVVVDEAEFDAERWYSILEHERVEVFYTSPTAVRMLMRHGGRPVATHDLSRLRFVGSVGEPLNAEAVRWAVDALGMPIHDNWWQTETGGIMVANFASMPIKPGSMGRPLPGIDARVVERREDGSVHPIDEPGREGELALQAGWPSMFRAYLDQPERYDRCFADGFYLSGDLARIDEDGYFWFVGRADDVIKSSGHLIGPFEVESVLMEHPAVVEVGVIGKPDPVAGAVVKAFVELRHGFEASEDLRRELIGHARKRLGSAVAPREVEFATSLPKTRSGKIMRRLLLARELGLPEGDTSTLETFDSEPAPVRSDAVDAASSEREAEQ